MVIELFQRNGTLFTGTVANSSTGKPGYNYQDRCGRCGGAGGSEAWRHTGWTCFDCGGTGKASWKWAPLYTAEKLAKLIAAQTKRDGVKEAKRLAANAAREAAVAANTVTFDTEHAALIADLGVVLESNAVVADIVRKGREKGTITDPQKSVLVNAVAAAKRHAEAQATSSHVGAIGDKVTVAVTVTNVGSYERAPYAYRYGGGMETVYIVTMTDVAGNVFVTKTPTFNEPKGESFTLSGTVKAHDEYKSVKQTVIIRPKRKEIPTGAAAGFKKIGE